MGRFLMSIFGAACLPGPHGGHLTNTPWKPGAVGRGRRFFRLHGVGLWGADHLKIIINQ